MISCGQVASLSYSQATGRISFSAKSWAISRMSLLLFCECEIDHARSSVHALGAAGWLVGGRRDTR